MTATLGTDAPLGSDPVFRRLLAWSFGGHLALGLVLTFSPSGRALIPAPRAVIVELIAAAPAAKPRAPRRQVVDEPVVIPKRAPKPRAKPAPAKAPPPLTAEQLIAKIRNENPEPVPRSAAPAAPATGIVDPLLAAYRARVQALLRRNWSGARAFAGQPTLHARFSVEINAAGTVVAVARKQGSGNGYYDESAERSIWRTEPFPVPPRGALTLDVNFRPGAVF